MKSSAVSGVIAAVSGMLGKFSSDGSTSLMQYIESQCVGEHCGYVLAGVRIGFFVAMLLSNALMLNFFVQGLHETDSLTATITSSAANFVVTAILGLLVFGEHLPLQWWLGATVILVGMGCLLHGDKQPVVEKTKDKKQG
ncbi:hypothetical protein THRCLA_09114 [Thraustotheca clavata]|uniref:EamA domain-containing protein n=1 Tax=Thraustotheca clavata TaxID=74557 RepID=A0A1V9YZD8_9STRA|nr:hypothetical protein THRCLA_09114 [Thraustotheca clavata]